jgi:protein required for attachment to host cells
MAAIINYIKEHEKVCLGLSLATLATYLIFRQKTAKKRNILEVTLKQLLARARHPKVRKIVITNNPKSTGNFRRNLVSFLKSKLLEEKIKVLINCSVLYL